MFSFQKHAQAPNQIVQNQVSAGEIATLAAFKVTTT
jgi:hypothetical protein